MWDEDALKKDDFMGSAQVPLRGLTNGEWYDVRVALQKGTIELRVMLNLLEH